MIAFVLALALAQEPVVAKPLAPGKQVIAVVTGWPEQEVTEMTVAEAELWLSMTRHPKLRAALELALMTRPDLPDQSKCITFEQYAAEQKDSSVERVYVPCDQIKQRDAITGLPLPVKG